MTATDLDNDGVNTFYYRLSFPSPEDQQYFDIDLNTGELSIIKKLDRDYPDGKAEFQFMVVVADDLVNPLLGYGDVSVRPKDINDNDPFFPVEDSEFRVLENQPVGMHFIINFFLGDKIMNPENFNCMFTIVIFIV